MPKSITVRDYMAANLVTFTPDMEILRAIHALVEKRINPRLRTWIRPTLLRCARKSHSTYLWVRLRTFFVARLAATGVSAIAPALPYSCPRPRFARFGSGLLLRPTSSIPGLA